MEWQIVNNDFVFTAVNDEDCVDILSSLTDNSIGQRCGDSFTIPIFGIYELTDGQRKILDLPNEYPYTLYIENVGLINRNGFKYSYKFTTRGENGALRLVSKDFPVIRVLSPNGETHDYLLPIDHYEAILEMNHANDTSFVDSSVSYNTLARIKKISERYDSRIKFNAYLDQYDVHAVDNVKLSLDSINGSLEILPELPSDELINSGLDEGLFAQAFDRRDAILPVYTIVSPDGKEHKVVLPEDSEEQLGILKAKLRHVTDPDEIQKILESPEYFMDEELFDLREFYSDRVLEIGLYHPSFSPFLCPYKSEWIPGFTIDDRFNGKTNIILKDATTIHQLKSAIDLAISEGLQYISFKGYQLDLMQAIEVYEMAIDQNAHPGTPTCPKSKNVLIIEENAESLGYVVDELNQEAPNQYEFHNIDGLKDDISLKNHQIEGVAWLQHLVKNKSKGCLLADDMGLGKTIQTLCFIDWHKRHHNPEKKPYLIVAPVSLLDNWAKEIKKFIKPDYMSYTIVHGGSVGKKRSEHDINWLKSQDVILTNYETVRSCQFNICAVDYAAVILDEAQKIKTPGTYVTCAAKALKADFRIAMTGTPVENSFIDLWCIMDFAIPGLLGNCKDFKESYHTPLGTPAADVNDLGIQIRNRLGVFFLRRKKIDVIADLPEKHEYKREVVMSPEQQNKYLKLMAEAQVQVQKNPKMMLELLYHLRRLSDSPFIVDCDDTELIQEEDLIRTSAKIQDTFEILDKIKAKGEKAIIFCIFKESQRILQRVIRSRYGYTPKIINGDTKVISTSYVRNFEDNYSRQQAIDDFEAKEGFGVIIMSPISAGMGLNVTAANHVIHFGRHWNPAKESQATDRAYRIGQDKPVSVYYPITVMPSSFNFKSFDQTLDALLMRKTELADATLFPTESREVKMEDFRGMFEQMHN